jgi:hypothetical protein
MFDAFYDKKRFRFIHEQLLNSNFIKNYRNQTRIKKTACLYGEKINVYIDTSDGVNEDLKIQEYCGRIKRVILDTKGKPFLFFKAAHSNKWSKNIEILAHQNNGKVIPFFKWSFNDNFYNHVYGKRKEIIEAFGNQKKLYDIGIYFSEKIYDYPKPSEVDPLISWPDHKNFNLPGTSSDTGNYPNNSRKNIVKTLKSKNFKILHAGLNYKDYISSAFQCKVIVNPPGIGEYTSRMVDQTYLGNAIVLRKNSYDNGYTWKKYLPEIDFNKSDWEKDLKTIIQNYSFYGELGEKYFNNCWSSEAIFKYFKEKINEQLSKIK